MVRHGRRTAGVAAICALITALSAPAAFAQVEDPGELPSTALRVGPPGGLTVIDGHTINTSADRDVFEICLTGGGDFSATTVGTGTQFDTQLFLLDGNGRGVYANDDAAGPGPSTLPAGHDWTPRDPGVYYLAISHFDFDPAAQKVPPNIFPNRTGLVRFLGDPAQRLPMTHWVGSGNSPGGQYKIFLTGARSCIPPDQAAPEIRLRTPAQGAVYVRGQLVTADYECVEEEGGSGLASCEGTVPSGQLIDTATLGSKSFTVTTSDELGNAASVTHTYTVVDRTPPLVSIASPLDGSVFELNQPVFAAFTCSDEAGGSGLVACDGDVPQGGRIDTGTPGPHTFTVRARDAAGNAAQATARYSVLFDFGGFLRPLVNPPGVNTVRAGRTVPVKFTLDRYRGQVFADGYPRSGAVPCGSGQNVELGEPTRGGHWVFPYRRGTDFHIYLWRTEKSWRGTCRQFVLKLVDGSEHRANFRFSGRPPRPPKPDKPHKPGKPGHDHDDDDRDDDDATTTTATTTTRASTRRPGAR